MAAQLFAIECRKRSMRDTKSGMITKQELIRILEEYTYDVPERSLGRPLEGQKVKEMISNLTDHLINPIPAKLADEKIVYLVSRKSDLGYSVFFDKEKNEFGLAYLDECELLNEIEVRGDLVGVWMAQ